MSNCLFCKIVNKTLTAKIKFENDSFIAIHDINPQAPTHLLVISKKHIAKISETKKSDAELLGAMVVLAQELARQEGIEDGFRLVFNNGEKAGQSVFHIHLHVLGGRKMTWPPG